MKIALVKSNPLPYEHESAVKQFARHGVFVVSISHEQPEDVYIAWLKKERPDFAFCFFQKGEWDRFFSACKKTGTPLAGWLIRDPYELDYTKRMVHHFDLAFSPDKNTAAVYRKLGHQHLFDLPHCLVPERYFPDKTSKQIYQSDLCITGDADHKKAGYINYLHRQTDWTLRVVGRGWSNAIREFKPSPRLLAINYWVPPQIARLFYSNTKIVLTIPDELKASDNATGFPAASPSPDFFAAAGCKAFQLVEKRKGIAGMFHSPKTIVQMNSKEECLAFAGHYLENEKARVLMAEAARNEIMRNHTITHRISMIVSCLMEYTTAIHQEEI
ncbi:CgeB family protein [Alteribacter keqinensis]|nr:glycosyltransferase [Alteribacter keqinensis]